MMMQRHPKAYHARLTNTLIDILRFEDLYKERINSEQF